jgi:tellurite resistance protein TerC
MHPDYITVQPLMWVGFAIFVIGMLAVDLGILNRKAHVPSFRAALAWSIVCISLAGVFNLWIYYKFGKQPAQEFLAGYLLEEALSVDNIFVFLMIFTFFKVPREYQHRLLYWGVLGALVLRGAMIAGGVALINKWDWILYVFGAILILTGIKMAFHNDTEADPRKGWIYRAARKLLPVAEGDHGQKFFVKINGRWYVTLMFLVLLIIETTDLLFALDSIPAVFAVTREPFIIYTSNVFAILGLRALYFVLAGFLDLFRYLKYGLAAILIFVGVKMLLAHTDYKVPINTALGVIVSLLVVSVIASLVATRLENKRTPPA